MLAEIEARALKLQRKLAVALATHMLCVGMLKTRILYGIRPINI